MLLLSTLFMLWIQRTFLPIVGFLLLLEPDRYVLLLLLATTTTIKSHSCSVSGLLNFQGDCLWTTRCWRAAASCALHMSLLCKCYCSCFPRNLLTQTVHERSAPSNHQGNLSLLFNVCWETGPVLIYYSVIKRENVCSRGPQMAFLSYSKN